MDTLGYVKKYKEELKDEKKYSSFFNIWAFIFSSLYFLYKRMYGHCFIFFVVPILMGSIFISILPKDYVGYGYMVILLIMHIIAGFVANPNYKKYMKKYINSYKDADLSKVVSYDSMSTLKLVFCMIFSGGLYSLYWGYKHWEKYQITTQDDVSPLGRAWFIHLTAPSLFSKIGKSINSNIKLQYLGIGFLICNLCIAIIDKFSESANVQRLPLFIVLPILFLLAILCLVFVQKKINEYNISQTNEKVKLTINVREIAVVIIGFILVGVLPFTENYKTTYSLLDEYTDEQQGKIVASAGFIYKHTKGYKEVCQKEGYIMTKYPNDFSKYFSSEINQLKHNLSEHNYTIENVENILLEVNGFKTELIDSIYTELEDLRKFTIMSVSAEEQGIPIEYVNWNNEWDNLLTFKDICKEFDESGIYMLKKSQNKYFLKENAL